ncbi:ornithine cyclodeaminase family protein [Microvirga antarctica]|uniref:ornithine cyclodeaminase family protein n=1 Tax=Microvirga antarctica TaxID=2819233 RepID=UPI001B30CC77|nr:ornithine cyclodeaminase family protein [Microvirga antarctica]
MLILNGNDVRAVLTMADCICVMDDVLRGLADGTYWQPPRAQIQFDGASSLMGLMPAFRSGPDPLWGFKHIIVAPGNRARGLDSHQGAVLLNDGETGQLMAVVDATAITSIRTAAVSAVATRALARPDAAQIAIIGTGHQASAHVEAMRHILPNAGIVIGARSPESARAFADATGTVAAHSIEDAVAEADVICTLTTAKTPILKCSWIKPGCHVNAVGTSQPSAREIDGELLSAAAVFVDSRAQADIECGEYLLALNEGSYPADRGLTELGDVLTGRQPGRPHDESITLFKSLGLAVEDLAAAEFAVRRATERQIGSVVAW